MNSSSSSESNGVLLGFEDDTAVEELNVGLEGVVVAAAGAGVLELLNQLPILLATPAAADEEAGGSAARFDGAAKTASTEMPVLGAFNEMEPEGAAVLLAARAAAYCVAYFVRNRRLSMSSTSDCCSRSLAREGSSDNKWRRRVERSFNRSCLPSSTF